MRPAVAIGLVLLAPAARATVVADWGLEEVLRRADTVVIGVIGAQRVVAERGLPYTETTLHVERALVGDAGPVLVVSQLGGGDASVAGDVRLVPGRRMLLALHERGGRRFIVGLVLGAWRLEGERAVQSIDVGLAGPGGRVRPGPGRREASLADIEAALAARRRP